MRKHEFYWSLIKRAFSKPLERADYIAGIIGLAGGVITYFFPSVRDIFYIGVWLIPISLLFVLSVYRLILSPYWIYFEEWGKRRELEIELKAINETRPNIIVDQLRESPLFRGSLVSNDQIPNYGILQAWFRNNPDIPGEKSEAKRVTALIEFNDTTTDEHLFSVYGQWAESTAPDHVGYSGITNEIDIPPGVLAGKLMIALKHLTDGNCYAYSRESITKFLDGRNPGLQLEPGKYRVCVLLNGIGVKQYYDFILDNPGVDGILKMEIADE